MTKLRDFHGKNAQYSGLEGTLNTNLFSSSTDGCHTYAVGTRKFRITDSPLKYFEPDSRGLRTAVSNQNNEYGKCMGGALESPGDSRGISQVPEASQRQRYLRAVAGATAGVLTPTPR